jgi:adenylate cyclase
MRALRWGKVVSIASDPIQAFVQSLDLSRRRRAILVVDVVESVRLMQTNEADAIDCWRGLVNEVRAEVLPACGGRLVKSLGDGLLLEFESAPGAVAAAFDIQKRMARLNRGHAPSSTMRLRAGIHVADIVVDDLDIYGAGVNLAARIAGLGGPGEVIVSEAARDQLVAGLDADFQDLGACYLKHISEPIHVYRVHGHSLDAISEPAQSVAVPLVPTIAVISFEGVGTSQLQDVIGDLLAGHITERLSRSNDFRVISRLSAAALRSRRHAIEDIGKLLHATFVVNGTYRVAGGRVVAQIELSDARNREVVWSDTVSCRFDDIVRDDNRIAEAVCLGIVSTIAANELGRVRILPLPTLEGFSLQIAGIALMHRSSRTDFDRGREVLEYLIERHPRIPEPRAWLAKWYVLRVTQGLVQNPMEEAGRALEQTRRALDDAPDCSLALAMEGFVHCHMLRDLDGADQRLDQSLQINPNESVAWLYKCVVQGFRGQGHRAMASAERAIELSPLDPLRHYYDGLAASAALAVGSLDRAIHLAKRSLGTNRNHLPTLRALAIALVESGSLEDARETAARVLMLEPSLTVRDYVARGPKGAEATRRRYGAALRDAGVPAG